MHSKPVHRRVALLVACAIASRTALAVSLPPGRSIPVSVATGSYAFTTTPVSQRPPTTAGHWIEIVRGDLGGGASSPKWILVAGSAGGYVEIARREMNGRDDSAAGENYLVLEPIGEGHALVTRSGTSARLVLLVYSASQRVGDPSSNLASAEIPGLSDLSGAPGLDGDLIFGDGLDPSATAP